jgi:hypothetical protein
MNQAREQGASSPSWLILETVGIKPLFEMKEGKKLKAKAPDTSQTYL